MGESRTVEDQPPRASAAGGSWLRYLDDDECEDLLAASWFGRLAVVADARPEVFPVNHVWDLRTRTIAFPTMGGGTKLASSLSWPWVAYEIDGVDEHTMTGWSVLVVGHAEEIADRSERERLARIRRGVWEAGPDDPWLRVVPTEITGRQLGRLRSRPR